MEFLITAFRLYTASAALFLEPTTLLLILVGGAIGMFFGVLPGLTTSMALALTLPATYWLTSEQGIVLLTVVYATGVFAGSITAILINIPGTPSAIVTGLDGYPMSQRGEAGRAIGAAAVSSAIGGLLGMVALVLVSVPLAEIALKFGSWEFAALMLMGIALIAFISGRSFTRGIVAGVFGLILGTIGLDPMTGDPRFTFGIIELVDGFELVPVLIGVYGVAEVLKQFEKPGKRMVVTQEITRVLSVVTEVIKMPLVLIRSSIIGIIIGALPGIGPGTSAATSYAVAKRSSKRSKELGTGSLEGVVIAESTNNACTGGTLIPTFTLGVPGSGMTALFLGAMMMHGLTPGPLLFARNPDFVSAAFISLTIASFVILLYGVGGARLYARFLAIPTHLLMPIILLLCIVGSFAIRNSIFDVGSALVLGVLGYVMVKVDIARPPLILGYILGPLFEDNFRRSLILGDGSLIPYFTRPISLGVIIFTILILVSPYLLGGLGRLRRKDRRETDV